MENDALPLSSCTVSDVGCRRKSPAPASSSMMVNRAERSPVVDSLGDVAVPALSELYYVI